MLDLKPLWELQKLLQEEALLKKELKSLPQVVRLRSLKEEIQALQEVRAKDKEKIAKLSGRIKKIELEIEVLKAKRKETSDKLYGGEITKVKEMESANLQVEQLQSEITDLENDLIKLMEDKEELQNKLNQLKSSYDARKSEYQKLLGDYQKQKEDLQEKIDSFPARKNAIVKSVDQELITVFNELQKKFPNSGITRVEQGICGGCHMRISFDLQNQLKNVDKIMYCDNCGRLILID